MQFAGCLRLKSPSTVWFSDIAEQKGKRLDNQAKECWLFWFGDLKMYKK